MSDLYDTDFVLWAKSQAELLRLRAAGKLANEAEVDWSNIAEEIESLGKSDQRELRNRVRTILTHLIKLQASPAAEPRAGWRATILEQRAELRVVLDDSPSLLRPFAERVLPDAYGRGRDSAMDDTGLLHMPELPPWPLNDVLATEFWPDAT